MSERLKADLVQIERMASDMRAIVGHFRGLPSLLPEYADAIGHYRLAQRLDQFTSDWHGSRRRLLDDLERIGTWLESVGDTLRKTDVDLARAVEAAVRGDG